MGEYDADRTLRGFTRPVNRITLQQREGLVAPGVVSALEAVYEYGVQATCFAVPTDGWSPWRPGHKVQAILPPDRMRSSGKEHHVADYGALMLGDEMREPPDTLFSGRLPDLLPDLLDRCAGLAVRLDTDLIA